MVEYTQLTLLHVIYLAMLPVSGIVGWVAGRESFGIIGGTVGAGAAAGLVHWTITSYASYTHKRRCRKIEESTNDELWAFVGRGPWMFWHTMALLNLAARGENVRTVLPRILKMLESEFPLTRVYGWDALRIVFSEETNTIGSYIPRGSTEDCRRRVTALRQKLGVAD